MGASLRFRVATASVLLTLGAAACAGSPATAHSPAPVAAAPQGLVASAVNVPPGLSGEPFDRPRQVLLPPGVGLSVWARVPGARLAAWTPDGTLLVSRPDAGEVERLTPDGPAAHSSVLIDGLRQPHGLAFDGHTLYVAESDRISAYDYSATSAAAPATASNRRTVVDGLPDSRSPELGGAYAHALKSVALGPDHALYFSIGSTGNISADDRSATPQRATIMRVPPGGGPARVFTRGVRNGTGLARAPDGSMWTAVNNRDQIGFPYRDGYPGEGRGDVFTGYVADHPPEELARLTEGRDLGWPFCNPDPDVHPGVAGTPLDYRAPRFVPDVQTNPDGRALDCAALPPVERTFGAHSAPLGLSFVPGVPGMAGPGALVGIHGSWNRTPPRAPEVSFFPWLPGTGGVAGTLGAQRTLVGGFQAPDGSRWGRPVAAVLGPDGAVYVTDDEAGAVYRVAATR
jgi:glucose/arabinose dehydrogenase